MNENDFERAWLTKFSDGLDRVAGEKIRREVMKGNEILAPHTNRQDVIDWTRETMERLESLVPEEKLKQVMTGCACRHPKSDLQDIRQKYEETKDLDLAHQMLQEQFVSSMRNVMKLDDDLIDEVIGRGWGLAGVRKENRIIATKIPKSANLVEYMKETDPEVKRLRYCHCPRVRDVLKSSGTLSRSYCYCGAGYYKDIWEEILQKPVDVKVEETVLDGGEICRFAICID